MVTVHDVAKKAGVSIATVSYALNNKKSVSKQTRDMIIKIAEEMGYVPNSQARGLHNKKTNIIGFISKDISSPYVSSLILFLEYYARKNDYFLLLGNTANDLNAEQEIIDRFISKNVDALILTPSIESSTKELYQRYQKIISRINKLQIPLICIESFMSGITTNHVIPDLEEGERIAARFLLDNGHRNIIFVGGWQNSTANARHNGMKKALDEAQIPYNSTNFVDCGYKFQDGYLGIKRFVEEGNKLPTAILAFNDTVAYGVIKGLKEKVLRVPDDISIIGFDDIHFPTIDTVPLTTVKIPLEEMSKLIIETIIRSQTDKDLTLQYLLKPQLVIRESVKRIP